MLIEIGQKAKETSYVLGKMGTNLKNAGLLAAKILATEDAALRERLKAYSSKLEQTVLNKADKLEHIDYEAYLKEM